MPRRKKFDFFDAVQERKKTSISKPKIKTPEYTPSLITDLQAAAKTFKQQTINQPETTDQPIISNPQTSPTDLSDSQSDRSDTISDRDSEYRTQKQKDSHTHNQIETITDTISQTLSETISKDPQIQRPRLSVQQTKIYNFLFDRVSGFTTAKQIEQITGVPLATVYISLRILRNLSVIHYTKFQKGVRKGLTFIVNQELPVETTAPVSDNFPVLQDGLESSKSYHRLYHTHRETDTHTHRENHQGKKPHYSSSSLLSNKTTTDEIENILSTHPELGYWRQKGLTSKQMKDWVKISSSIENLIQSLCYCRYEMVDLNLEESKPIDNVFNWFFKIIEKAGSYPKPKGYQSFEDKQVEQERVALEEKEKRVEELKSLSRKKWELDREETFWEMMNDPDGNLYKECHVTLNNFAKKSKGKVLESSMRSAFDKIMNERDKGT